MRHDITFEQYLLRPELNASKIKLCIEGKSLLQAKYAIDNDNDKPCFQFGRSFHSYMETGAMPSNVVLSKYDDFRSGEARAWKAEQEAHGRTVLKDKEYQALADMYHSVNSQVEMWGGSAPEVCYAAGDLKAYVDVACESRLAIRDWKTTRDISPRYLINSAIKYGYHIQSHHYTKVFAEHMEEDPHDIYFEFVFVQVNPPHEVVIMPLSEDFIELGAKDWAVGYERLKIAMQNNYWPGHGKTELILPEWVNTEEEVEIDYTK